MQNHLKKQTSPYLLQHVNNPVDWYPWCKEAFERAKAENKPIFLSIGYSTCHWCHVMAHESFEDAQVAEILNKYFIAIKVDKEERPDIDSIYMSVCQAFTGSGGWPTSIFLTPDQKPFFAGTYFPKLSRYGRIGFIELLETVYKKWITDREALLESAGAIVAALEKKERVEGNADSRLIASAVSIYKQIFDNNYGGFGDAPKFPTPHNLLFLMQYYEKNKDKAVLEMVEKTLQQMYRGGIFDHIGGGFSRYSTDKYFLVPHFEKMLYDNALLIIAYCKAYQLTKKPIYCEIARRTASYILREMTANEGGFYSAQDADSEGVEGRYYVFEPTEVVKVLGKEDGEFFSRYFDITEQGNFEGKSIPNLLKNMNTEKKQDGESNKCFESSMSEKLANMVGRIYEYRKKRYSLHLDDKILTSWNALMIAAMCHLYRVTKESVYVEAAIKAQKFLENQLCEKDTFYVSYRNGRRNQKGFLDDYANDIYALLALYEATFKKEYLSRAIQFCKKVISDFYDKELGGFFLYGKDNEQLILQPKETYDGAVFSGNSIMAYNLVQLYQLTGESWFEEVAKQQMDFMSAQAEHYPIGYSMFLVALSDYLEPPEKITIVVKETTDLTELPYKISLSSIAYVLEKPTKEQPLKNDKTTFYICRKNTCFPPKNELDEGWI